MDEFDDLIKRRMNGEHPMWIIEVTVNTSVGTAIAAGDQKASIFADMATEAAGIQNSTPYAGPDGPIR